MPIKSEPSVAASPGVLGWVWRAALALPLAVALVISLACNSPFIPIPPPGDPTFTPMSVSDGMGGVQTVWQVSGGPASSMSNAKVYVFNADLHSGVIAQAGADGSYVTIPLDGRLGDRVEVSYETPAKKETSETTCRILAVGVAHQPCSGGASDAGN